MPPIFYMNSASKTICNIVRDLNTAAGQNIACYSIDAGFHVFVFCLLENLNQVKGKLEADSGQMIERLIET